MSDEHEHEHHKVNYTAIFGLLCVCTLLSIFLDLGKDSISKGTLIVLILSVALCKATFVLLYFMHIKFEAAWKYVLLAPTGVLACALPFALAPDIAFHYYNVLVPQGLVAAQDHDAHGDAHGDAAHGKEAAAAKHDDHHDTKAEAAPKTAPKADKAADKKAH
ncbi:MAG: cytochrome C oxidase subunit IV family protein [Planctomycetota bacterium]